VRHRSAKTQQELDSLDAVRNVAHKLADFTLHEPCMLTRELLLRDRGFSDLGLAVQHVEPLFDSTVAIEAELDRYLSP